MKRAHQFEVDVGTASLSLRSVPSRGGILGWKGAPWGRGASLNNELLAAQLQGIMAAFILTVRGCVYLCLWMFVFLHTTICISARKASCFFFLFLYSKCVQSVCKVYVCVCACVCWYRLTELAHFQNLAQHLGQLDAAAAERTLVFVFSTAVLQDNLETRGYKISQARNRISSGL